MRPVLEILEAGPSMTLQDLGREGQLADGLTRGGAMDRLALYEAAAILSQPVTSGIEMVGLGGRFKASTDVRIALTGAPMAASIDGTSIDWHASHQLAAGQVLKIGGVKAGSIGYLSVGGGFDVARVLGAQSAHLIAGIGAMLSAGEQLPVGVDAGRDVDMTLVPEDRFHGGDIAITTSFQTELFGKDLFRRFLETQFTKDPRANRQGIKIAPKGEGFAAAGGLKVVSEIIVPGDIQIAGDGMPFVLMCESQSTGGYPRIATVLPSDLPKIAQAQPGEALRFRLLGLEEAVAYEEKQKAHRRSLAVRVMPRFRDPRTMPDLLSYSLISGVVSATEDADCGDIQ